MELVIKIPDKDYEFIKDVQLWVLGSRGGGKTINQNVINAIKNGTPLPKGHGDLIDKDQFEQLLRKYGLDYEADSFIPLATTVIDADKENDNGTDNQDT